MELNRKTYVNKFQDMFSFHISYFCEFFKSIEKYCLVILLRCYLKLWKQSILESLCIKLK